jgi:hypothetical protein
MDSQEILDVISGNYSSFDGELVSDFEVDNLVTATGMERRMARQMIAQAKQKPRVANGVLLGTPKKMNVDRAKAQFSLLVTRNTRTLAVELPVPLFGAVDLESGYANALAQYLPTGITVSNVQYGIQSGKAFERILTISFTDGTNTDTVTISCKNMPYPSFLSAIQSDVFINSLTRYTLGNTANQDQYNAQFTVAKKSLFGKQESDDITPNAYKDPNQNQTNIVDINIPYGIDKNTTVILGFKHTTTGTVGLDFFVSSYERTTVANELRK